MTEYYVSFKQAKLLKEKGFPQESTREIRFIKEKDGILEGYQSDVFGICDEIVCYPTLSLVKKWLFDEKHIFIGIKPYFSDPYVCYEYTIYVDCDNTCEVADVCETNSTDPEEALSEAINKVLEMI